MPSFAPARVPAIIDQASRSAPTSACGLKNYDNRIVPRRRGRASPVSGPSYEGGPDHAGASRLTPDDCRPRPTRVLGTLTPGVVQNNSSIDGHGFHRVNFASAVFLIAHSLIRPGAFKSKPRRRAKMLDLTFIGDLFAAGPALTPFSCRNPIASATTRTPHFNHPTASGRASRGRKE